MLKARIHLIQKIDTLYHDVTHRITISSVVRKGDEVQSCSCCSLQGSPGMHDRFATPEGQSAVIGSWDIKEWRMNYISLDMNGLYVWYVYIHLTHLCSFMQYLESQVPYF